MAYRVVALSLAAGLSLSSAVLAKEQCLVGELYFRSKHICVAKGTLVTRNIYRYRPPAAHEAAVHRPAYPAGQGGRRSPPANAAARGHFAGEGPFAAAARAPHRQLGGGNSPRREGA